MSSGSTTRWQRMAYRWLPWLFKRCPEENYHWRWDRYCCCRLGQNCGGFHGGVLDMWTGDEIPYTEYQRRCKADG